MSAAGVLSTRLCPFTILNINQIDKLQTGIFMFQFLPELLWWKSLTTDTSWSQVGCILMILQHQG